jgi:hypothetical protein
MLAQACSGDDSSPGTPDSGTGNKTDASVDGTTPTQDSGQQPGEDGGSTTDGSTDAPAEGTCADPTWYNVPSVDPSIVPEAGTVIIHASATGTQDYTCEQTADAGGVYQWVFVGPEAVLSDCNSIAFAHHFASDAGPGAPEWMSDDTGSYVIAKKQSAFTPPDGGANSVPWLLLQETSASGAGVIATTQQINRINTNGGNAPDAAACDMTANGTTQKVPYTADYYFYK